jgi:hypothetical protein
MKPTKQFRGLQGNQQARCGTSPLKVPEVFEIFDTPFFRSLRGFKQKKEKNIFFSLFFKILTLFQPII